MKRLKFNKKKCLGCQLCAQICSAMHEGVFNPSKARIFIETYYDKGMSLRYRDDFCIGCGKCAKSCPQNAIFVAETIIVKQENCTGCGNCVEACPKKVVRLRRRPILRAGLSAAGPSIQVNEVKKCWDIKIMY